MSAGNSKLIVEAVFLGQEYSTASFNASPRVVQPLELSTVVATASVILKRNKK